MSLLLAFFISTHLVAAEPQKWFTHWPDPKVKKTLSSLENLEAHIPEAVGEVNWKTKLQSSSQEMGTTIPLYTKIDSKLLLSSRTLAAGVLLKPLYFDAVNGSLLYGFTLDGEEDVLWIEGRYLEQAN